jgi:hypothetical protein
MEGDPALIALHSVKGAGKDTTFQFIQDWCGKRPDPAPSAVRRGFADKAKWAYMRQWVPGCTEQWAIAFVDQWKNDPEATCAGIFTDPEDGITLSDSRLDNKEGITGRDEEDSPLYFIPPVIFRQHMAQFATESARDIYGMDHWADQVLPLEPTDRNPEGWRGSFMVPPRTAEEDPYSFAHFAVMTDMRFENELLRVRELGGLNVKIKRRDAEQAVIEEAELQGRKVHESELGLPDEWFDVVLNNNDNNMDNAYRRTAHMMHEIDYNGIASIKRGVPIPWVL